MNGTRQVTIIVPLAFLVYTIGRSEAKGSVTLPEARQLIAWMLLFLILVAIGDLEATGEIAAALSWLILLTVFLTYGVSLFTRVSSWVE
jgi:hypothetical protein